ncbi:hypothetical protein CFK37_04385 [Virgibacillus phasianinus]|uniref:Uncharacterized protein n=1 Tax=Virgibacillus phasianinus TaxID=2017483 RepID=A0A220U0L1_9BACI|nr:hypothetical protein CFK37_04385 [Virgibacillus phasianinus]
MYIQDAMIDKHICILSIPFSVPSSVSSSRLITHPRKAQCFSATAFGVPNMIFSTSEFRTISSKVIKPKNIRTTPNSNYRMMDHSSDFSLIKSLLSQPLTA